MESVANQWLNGHGCYQDQILPRTPKERVQKVAEVYVHLEEDARVLVCRRRVFANRVVRLWVQDMPELRGIQICACDEAYGGFGQLFISDENLQRAYRHFARGRLGGFGADLGPKSIQDYPPICTSHLMEVALTEELMASLLDSVCFEVNEFGDEWFIYLPGFGKARAEIPQGPAMRVASQSSGIPRRRPHSADVRNSHRGGRRPPGQGAYATGAPLGHHHRSMAPGSYDTAGPMPRPLGNRLQSMAGGDPVTLPGEPITGYDEPSEPSPNQSDWRDSRSALESWTPRQAPRSRPSSPLRPSSAVRPSSAARSSSASSASGKRPWMPPGISKCLEPAPLLSEPMPCEKRSMLDKSRQSASKRIVSGQGAPERWTSEGMTGMNDEFSRGTPEEATFYTW